MDNKAKQEAIFVRKQLLSEERRVQQPQQQMQ